MVYRRCKRQLACVSVCSVIGRRLENEKKNVRFEIQYWHSGSKHANVFKFVKSGWCIEIEIFLSY